MLYHYMIGFPKVVTKFGKLNLEYSNHALRAACNDRYGLIKLPMSLDTDTAKLIEIEVENRIVTKAVYRITHCNKFDLVIVVIPQRQFVKTVWLNSNEDKHFTLDRSKYSIP